MSGTSRKRILVVDDETDVVELVRVVLSTKGYDVIPTYNGEDGLNAAVAEKPDLIITDLKMPGMSGMEFIKRIRSNPEIAGVPVLVISSLGSQVDKPDEFWTVGLGSDDFLAKPFDPLGLLGRVEYLLRKGSYVSERQNPVGSGQANATPAAGISTNAALKSDNPADVVRAFVLAWNDQDFVLEYDCLGDEMLYGLGKNEYIQRRMQSYADDKGVTRHQVIDAETLKTGDATATVACLRDDSTPGGPSRKDERYTLKKTPAGWKIVNVRSRALAMS
jgi:CheY-like chemotaxis protein